MPFKLFIFTCFLYVGVVQSKAGYALERNTLDPLVLNENQNTYSLGTFAQYFEDTDGVLSITDIASPAYAEQFISNTNNVFSVGYSQSVFWLRFAIDPGTARENWYLEVPFPLIDYLDLYIPQEGGGFKRYQQGDAYPFSQRSIESNHFIFDLDILSPTTYYIRVNTRDSIQVPLILRSEHDLRESTAKSFLLSGVYFGLMFAIVLYNIFIYISVKDKAYFYYIFYIATFALLQSGVQGFNFRFMWPESPEWGNSSIPILSLIMVFLGAQFTRAILQIKSYSKRLDRSLNIFSVAVLGIIPLLLFGSYSLGISLTISFCFVFFNLVLFAGIVGLHKKVRAARYFVIAWATYLVAGSIYVLMITGFLPVNVFTVHAIQVGSAVEVILLSMALADRINSLKHEKSLIEVKSMEALAKVNARLERSNRYKDEFISTVSHEIRTPMNGVVGMTEILLGTDLTAEQRESLRIITQSGKSLVEILDRVLDYSRIDSGELYIHKAPFNIRSILTECIELFYYQSKQSSVPIHSTVDDEVPEFIVSDALRIKQLLINLVGNALKFTKTGQITIQTSLEYNLEEIYLAISVTDTGIGIPEDKAKLIFDAFSQADASTSRAYGGTGLGLTISKKLVEKMGGELTVTSEQGVGTTFNLSVKIEIPGHQTNPDLKIISKADPENNTEKLTDLSYMNVLVVEDNPVNQLVLCGLLKKLGITAVKVDNGKQAIECIKDHKFDFDIIFMDCEMPEMDGFETTQEIKKLYALPTYSTRHLPKIYAVSAHDKSRREKDALMSGMNGYLEKPLYLSSLKALIEGSTSE